MRGFVVVNNIDIDTGKDINYIRLFYHRTALTRYFGGVISDQGHWNRCIDKHNVFKYDISFMLI